MKVIAVANQKGGVGKTTVTRELRSNAFTSFVSGLVSDIVHVAGGLSASQIAEGQENGFALVSDSMPTTSLVLFLVIVLCVGVFIGCLAKRVAPYRSELLTLANAGLEITTLNET